VWTSIQASYTELHAISALFNAFQTERIDVANLQCMTGLPERAIETALRRIIEHR